MFHDQYGSRRETDPTAFNAIRTGRVIDRRMGQNGPEVLVTYYDRDITSDWLPVGQQGSSGASMFYCPRTGDNVTVLHFPTAIETGVVVCTNPTSNGGAIQPDSINSIACRGDNGEQFSYNPDSKTLAVQGCGTIKISASGDVSIQANGNLTMPVGSTMKVTATTINLNGVIIDANGNVTIPGNLTIVGTTTMLQLAIATPHCQNTDGSGGGS
jgi:phage baseplate assembly protein V